MTGMSYLIQRLSAIMSRAHPAQDVRMKVRQVIKMLKQDGWVQVRMKGSHRHFQHPTKSGTTTVAGKLSDDLAAGTYISILKQAGLR